MSLQGACGGLTIIACDDVAILDEGVFQGEAAALNFTGPGVTATVVDGVGTINITGGGGSSAFNDITSGTNTTAAMVVDTGASISATGSGSITATAVPVGGVSGLGTGVATALAVNVGSAGAFVVNGGALGTPSSGVATNLTGTAAGLTAGTVTTNANLTGDVTSVGNATTYNAVVGPAKGGTGVANNAAMTVTGSGNFAYTRTLTGVTNVTFPTTGTLATLAGSEALTNKSVNGVTLTAAGSATDFLNAAGNYVAAGGGSGDVVGPASSTDNALATFDLTTGKLLQNSVIIGDPATGNMSGIGTIASGVHTITATNASALAVGRQGATNPALKINSSSGTSVSGFEITAGTTSVTMASIGSAADVSIALQAKGSGAITVGSASVSSSVTFQSSGNSNVSLADTSNTFRNIRNIFDVSGRADSTAANPRFSFIGAANTALTNTTEFTQVYFNMAQTNQHASNGTVALQRDMRISGMTHTAASATKTFTNTAALAIDGYAQAGTNSQITNGHGLYIPTQAVAGTVTNAYGITVAAPTGAGTINAAINATGDIRIGSGNMLPNTSDGAALGTTALMWSDLFLASGGVINWDNGDVTLTHSTDTLTFAGAASGFVFNSDIVVNNEIRIDATPGTDDTATGPTTNTFNAGATVAQWELVYLDSSSTWQLTDADAASTSGPVMLALSAEAKTSGQAMKVVLPGGFARNDAWAWTPGAALYVDTTAGAITATAPSGSGDIVRVIGYATTADTIYFMPSGAWVEVA